MKMSFCRQHLMKSLLPVRPAYFCFSSLNLIFLVSFKKWIRFLECSLNHEYFRSLAKWMNSMFGMFMELWILRVSFKVNFARDPKYSWFHEHSRNWIHCLYLYFISVKTDSQWSKQEACFAHVTQVWLAVNHNTSVTSGEWIWCS